MAFKKSKLKIIKAYFIKFEEFRCFFIDIITNKNNVNITKRRNVSEILLTYDEKQTQNMWFYCFFVSQKCIFPDE